MSDDETIETGWRIHGALVDWTSNVDSKASFLSAINVALLAGIVALRSDEHQLADLRGAWQNSFFWAGCCLLVLATLLVLLVVSPHLGRSKFENDSADHLIFFGHLKYWYGRDDELVDALRSKPVLPMLAKQLAAMSRIAWKKHRRLQLSVWCTLGGGALVALAALCRELSSLGG